MTVTRTSKAESAFTSWRSFRDFRSEVTRTSRYFRSRQATDFLTRLAAQSHNRLAAIPKGRILLRAQVAHHDRYDPEIGGTIADAALPKRMRPLPERATEGRVNPKGIPCLYLASDKHTAVAEVRPWIGSLITLAYFEVVRDLRVVDCSRDMDSSFELFDAEPEPDRRDNVVWGDIGRAFREPVTRDDDIASYAPTQVIAEAFRAEGFDGVAYRSAFGTDRFNVALFDLQAAEITSAELHEIQDVKFEHEQSSNPYFVQFDETGATVLVRNVITEILPIS